MIDAHCHLQFPAFDRDRDEVIARARDAGIARMILADYDAARRDLAADLAAGHDDIEACCGLHPWAVAEIGDDEAGLRAELERVDAALARGGWVALGESGLDGLRGGAQERALRWHLDRARAREMAVVLHCVRAEDRLAQILGEPAWRELDVMLHGFGGSIAQLERLLGCGPRVFVSLGTAVLNHDGRRTQALARAVPRDRLLVESDAPDRPPRARQAARNEPSFVVDVLARVAGLRGVEVEALGLEVARNAVSCFGDRGVREKSARPG